jgi:hypothetical protein
MFEPIILKNVFSEDDISKIREIVRSGGGRRRSYDGLTKRQLIKHDDFEQYFSKKLEPIAAKIFGDPTLKTSFSLYAKYDNKSSWLPKHVDRDACTYTLDYCLSAKTVWPLNIENVAYPIQENEALAFMGEDSYHWRDPMPDPETNEVEMIFFHFVPENHWFFRHCEDFYPER